MFEIAFQAIVLVFRGDMKWAGHRLCCQASIVTGRKYQVEEYIRYINEMRSTPLYIYIITFPSL